MVSFKKILVPVDFGKEPVEAGARGRHRTGQAVRRRAHARPHAGHSCVLGDGVMEFSVIIHGDAIESAATEQLDALVAEVKRQLPDVKGMLARGVAWREVLSAVEQTKPDLVVMGTHGRRGARSRAILGSVAEKIVRMSPVPVLTVRSKTADESPRMNPRNDPLPGDHHGYEAPRAPRHPDRADGARFARRRGAVPRSAPRERDEGGGRAPACASRLRRDGSRARARDCASRRPRVPREGDRAQVHRRRGSRRRTRGGSAPHRVRGRGKRTATRPGA